MMNVLIYTIPDMAANIAEEQNFSCMISSDKPLKLIEYAQYDMVRTAGILERITSINLFVFDATKEPVWRLAEFVKKHDIDIAITDSYSHQITDHFEGVIETLKAIKSAKNDCITLMSGRDPTFYYEQMLKIMNDLDIVAYGESERTISELISSLGVNRHAMDWQTNLQEIYGLAFRSSDGTIVTTLARKLISDLDELPYPQYSHLKIDNNSVLMIQSARGCPFSCNYCYKLFRKVRAHSPEYVVRHIEMLMKKYGVKRFTFDDEITGTNINWLRRFAALVMKNKIQIKYNCYGRADLVSEESVRLLAKSGCYEFRIGVESGSKKILKAMNKKISPADIKRAFKLLHSHKINTLCFILLGYPPEDHDTIKETMNLLDEIRPSLVSAKLVYVLPGTALYNELIAKKLIDDSMYFYKPGRIVPSGKLTIQELIRYRDKINSKYYNPENIDEY